MGDSMTTPAALLSAALLPALLLATLAMAPAGRAGAAEAIGAAQVIDLVAAAKHISFGRPQVVTLDLGGRGVAFTVSVGPLGGITAVPVAADKAVRQISIAVTTTNTGVVPNAVTVITGDGQVQGFAVTLRPDGTVLALTEGAPVSVPPPRRDLADYLGQDGHHDQVGTHPDGGDQPPIPHGPTSDLVDDKPPLPPGTPSPGGGLPYAPGTSPQSQFVSPH